MADISRVEDLRQNFDLAILLALGVGVILFGIYMGSSTVPVAIEIMHWDLASLTAIISMGTAILGLVLVCTALVIHEIRVSRRSPSS
ncbi:MAG: hypothetical protein MPK62_01465 [Alphaproteobacteria bacterium]|nr:hypothetical protein [Alphaproteobacteria bacterium]MDA8029803.1 hypothetical protein [Alphaproteobacteria bacterium]